MSVFVFNYMNHHKRVCIFIDGENLRHSIVDLFSDFKEWDYLPKNARWAELFDWIVKEVGGENAERIRTYWYVVQNIDFFPYNLETAQKTETFLEELLSKDETNKKKIQGCKKSDKSTLLKKILDELLKSQDDMRKRFSWWVGVQDGIARTHKSIEFRRAGAIRYDLFRKSLGSEKAVDVKLATDLIKLKDIYDIAIIISGDQDYVPAVETIKDYGKHTINVAFQKEDGKLLPGGARRLNQTTDWDFEVKHSDLKKHLFPGE